MNNSLFITKYVRDILEKDEELMKKIPIKRFYPIESTQGAKYPFAVITRTGMNDKGSKDGIYEDVMTVSIIVMDDNYINSIVIINEIRNWLEGHRYSDEDINITKFELNTSSELYYEGAYIQEVVFNVYIYNDN